MSKKDPNGLRGVIFCCHGGSCARSGARDVERALRQSVREQSLKSGIKFVRTACAGMCKQAPVVVACANARPGSEAASSTCGARWLLNATAGDAPAILAQHFGNGQDGTSATPAGTEPPESPAKKPKKSKKSKAKKRKK